jgi:endopeptidase La
VLKDYHIVIYNMFFQGNNGDDGDDDGGKNIDSIITRSKKRKNPLDPLNVISMDQWQMLIEYDSYGFFLSEIKKQKNYKLSDFVNFFKTIIFVIKKVEEDPKLGGLDNICSIIPKGTDKQTKEIKEKIVNLAFLTLKDVVGGLLDYANQSDATIRGIALFITKKRVNLQKTLNSQGLFQVSISPTSNKKPKQAKVLDDSVDDEEFDEEFDEDDEDDEDEYGDEDDGDEDGDDEDDEFEEEDKSNRSITKKQSRESSEDREFIEYMNSSNKGERKELSYFKSLTTSLKQTLNGTLGKIAEINNNSKPYLFRALESNMPVNVKAEVVRKVELSGKSLFGGDNYKLNSWIEALLNVPFGLYSTPECTNTSDDATIKDYMTKSKKTLDDAIYGHDKAKNKILQVIAQNLNNPKSNGLVLGIEGPMGNGKTTLIEQGVSKVLNRPFSYIALGGATDGSFLDGHSYTYEGSLWGKLVDILMKAKTMDPIIYFDELDKVSRTDKGDEITNILMHLIDSSQNKHFNDKYFTGIDFDFSRVTFIFSYNDGNNINPILRDRITEIKTTGFKTAQKVHIANNYLIPCILKDMGYKKGDIVFNEDILQYIIDTHTSEGGVRKLKEIIYELVRELNLRKWISKPVLNKYMYLPFTLNKNMLIKDLLKTFYKFKPDKINDTPQIGVVNGMYATTNGTGGLINIEVSHIPTTEKLHLELTGQQGNVMKESMKVAKTLSWNLIPDKHKKGMELKWKKQGITGFHIHCPEGATPKDGPSAGLAITTALVSSLTDIPIRNDVSITGEVDLNGRAMEIGGLSDKLYGAKRAGIKLALCPRDNKECLDKIKTDYPDLIDKSFEVKMVDNIWDVMKHSLMGELVS